MLPTDARRAIAKHTLLIIALLGTISVAFPRETQTVSGSLIFEVALTTVLGATGITISRRLGLIAFLTPLYLGYCFFVALFIKKTALMDALIAYKFLWYILILALLRPGITFNTREIFVFTNILIGIFFAKYFVAQIGGYNERPGVFYENNFELLFLLLLAGFLSTTSTRGWRVRYALILVVVILSGSRFAVLGYFIILLFGAYRNWENLYLAKKLAITLTIISAPVILYIALSWLRPGATNFENIDRLEFLLVFMEEAGNWGFINWLTGSTPLTSLSSASCAHLSYYSALFSSAGDGVCYSVILHSMLLRLVFDHGLLGLAFVGYAFYKIVIAKGKSKELALMIISLLLANSISVSSINSPFAIFAICIIITCGSEATEERQCRPKNLETNRQNQPLKL